MIGAGRGEAGRGGAILEPALNPPRVLKKISKHFIKIEPHQRIPEKTRLIVILALNTSKSCTKVI